MLYIFIYVDKSGLDVCPSTVSWTAFRESIHKWRNLVIWICFWFSICQAQQKLKQILNWQPAISMFSPFQPIYQHCSVAGSEITVALQYYSYFICIYSNLIVISFVSCRAEKFHFCPAFLAFCPIATAYKALAKIFFISKANQNQIMKRISDCIVGRKRTSLKVAVLKPNQPFPDLQQSLRSHIHPKSFWRQVESKLWKDSLAVFKTQPALSWSAVHSAVSTRIHQQTFLCY